MTDASLSLPRTVHRTSSGGCVALFSMTLILPMSIGAFRFLTMEQGLDAAATGLGVAGAVTGVLLAIYIFFGSTMIYTVTEGGLLVQRQYGIGPLRGAPRKDYEVLWSQVRVVEDVAVRRVSQHGNVNTTHILRFGEHAVSSSQFGTMERDGEYLAFVECVRAAVGPKLVSKDDLGGLEAPLARMIDARVAEREAARKPSDDER